MVSRAKRTKRDLRRPVSDLLQRALSTLRVGLGARDVLTDGKDRVWVLAGPRRLKEGLRGYRMGTWLSAVCKKGAWDHVRSYVENADHWDGWESAIRFGLDCLGIDADDFQVWPVPASTVPFSAWSVSKKRWLPKGPKPRVRLCEQAPVPFGPATGPVLIEISNDLPPLMLTHGVSLEKFAEVRRCGGLLWPSWALSWRMPPTYGDLVFFASTQNVMDLLAPTGGKDKNIYVAGTDIWSPDARRLRQMELAIEHELSATPAWWGSQLEIEEGGHGQRGLQDDLVIEGIKGDDLVGRMSYFEDFSITKEIRSRKQLVRRMKKIFATYADPADPYVYPERDPMLRSTDVPYPYGEIKVVGVVKLDDIPLVVYPKRLRRRIDPVLDALGFRGVRLRLAYDGPLHKDSGDEQRRAYASLVTAAVLRWAAAPCHTKDAEVGPALRNEGSWVADYQATAMWVVGGRGFGPFARSESRGHCGTLAPGQARASTLSQPMQEFLSDKQYRSAAWSLELASALDELDEPEISAWFRKAEHKRFRLSKRDAAVANELGWLPVRVEPGTEVAVIRSDTAWNPDANGLADVRAGLLAL